ncbi:MAG: peptidoglycan-binding protein [Acidimicrobiia bacterium]|nr:peptidoglycan-binding protein [Acidimicrobiia bacterium]
MSRRKIAAGFVFAIIVAALGGWLAGRQITTPAEIAALTAAPEPSPILVPVERRVLTADVVTRGTGRYGTPREVSVAPSPLAPSPAIVTDLPSIGTVVAEGEVLFEVSGRPVIVLEGSTPSFRDLGPAMSGDDVAQLEAALDRLGLEPGPVDGRYDGSTEAAVRRLYDTVGSEPAVVRAAQLGELVPPAATAYPGSTPGPGVMVAAAEIYFTASLPLRVAEIGPGLGRPVDGPVLFVTDAAVAIDGTVPIEQSGLIAVGMPVRIDEPDLGIEASGAVSVVADGPGTDGADGFHVHFEVSVPDAPPSVVNASVRLSIATESTADEVLVVPVAALYLTANGDSVIRVERDGELTTVAVRPGLTARGLVEVEAVDGQLVEGEPVVIGFDEPGSEQVDAGAEGG